MKACAQSPSKKKVNRTDLRVNLFVGGTGGEAVGAGVVGQLSHEGVSTGEDARASVKTESSSIAIYASSIQNKVTKNFW